MSEHCDDCTWDAWQGIDLCPKHAAVDDLLALYDVCQEALFYTDWMDAEQDIRKAVEAIAEAEPKP